MGRAKKKAGTNSSSEGDTGFSTFAYALSALREMYLGPDQGQSGKAGTLEDETSQRETATKRAILKVDPTKKLELFVSGFNEWQGKLCEAAADCYQRCFDLAMSNQTEVDTSPVEFAKSFTTHCFSKFLGVALLDGTKKPKGTSRVRWFVRHACGDYSDREPQSYPPRHFFSLPYEFYPRWRDKAKFAESVRNRIPAEAANAAELLNRANAEFKKLPLAKVEAQTEEFFLEKEQTLIKSLRDTVADARRSALVRLGNAASGTPGNKTLARVISSEPGSASHAGVISEAVDRAGSDANFWKSCRDEFERLADEEVNAASGLGRILTVNYDGETDYGEWFVLGGYSQDFTARFCALASRAGAALGVPHGVKPMSVWFRQLHLDLLDRKSQNLSGGQEDRVGIIQFVPRESATLCSRLETRSIEENSNLDSNRIPQKMRASAQSSNRKGRKPAAVELGRGGVRFVREGQLTLAEPCNDTTSAVSASYKVLCTELPKVSAVVKMKKGLITGEGLRKLFRSSVLAKVADQKDWDDWAEGFSPKNPARGRPNGAALTFLERKMNLDRTTIKSYASRAKSAAKERKSTTRNPSQPGSTLNN